MRRDRQTMIVKFFLAILALSLPLQLNAQEAERKDLDRFLKGRVGSYLPLFFTAFSDGASGQVLQHLQQNGQIRFATQGLGRTFQFFKPLGDFYVPNMPVKFDRSLDSRDVRSMFYIGKIDDVVVDAIQIGYRGQIECRDYAALITYKISDIGSPIFDAYNSFSDTNSLKLVACLRRDFNKWVFYKADLYNEYSPKKEATISDLIKDGSYIFFTSSNTNLSEETLKVKFFTISSEVGSVIFYEYNDRNCKLPMSMTGSVGAVVYFSFRPEQGCPHGNITFTVDETGKPKSAYIDFRITRLTPTNVSGFIMR